MPDIWLVSDQHFGHANILTFKNHDGTPVRSFSSVEEMDETMIQNHNKVVKPEDKVYFLGDVTFNKNHMDRILPRLNGKKKLILGNHDTFRTNSYLAHFYDVAACKTLKEKGKSVIMTHVPIHTESLSRWVCNLHGHLHCATVKQLKHTNLDDSRYRNMCVERTNFAPVNLEEILDAI